MSNQNHELFRRLYLLQEIDVSISVIESGLAILQESQGNRRHFAFMILLSAGLERLMKIVISLQAFKISGRFLSNSDLRNFSHKLSDLRSRVIRECFTAHYFSNPIAQEDLDFLTSDKLLSEILDVLSDFALKDRYIYLNGIDEPEKVGQTPERRWERLKDSTRQGNEDLVVCLEKFVRALARILTSAGLEDTAHVYSPRLHIFLETSTQYSGERKYGI